MNSQNVGFRPEAGDDSAADRADEGDMPERLARLGVGEVHLDRGNATGGNRITQRNTGMRVRGGIQDDDVEGAGGLLNPGHQFALVV